MNLDVAHQLSLIQRNLEMAQLSIDSATELLNIVINGATITIQPGATAPAPVMVAPNGYVARSKPKPKAKPKQAAAPIVEERHIGVGRHPVKKAAPSVKQAEVPVQAAKRADGKFNHAPLIAEFAAHHSGEFSAGDILTWAKEHGHAVDKKKFLSSIYNSAHGGKVITQVGVGVYKRVAT